MMVAAQPAESHKLSQFFWFACLGKMCLLGAWLRILITLPRARTFAVYEAVMTLLTMCIWGPLAYSLRTGQFNKWWLLLALFDARDVVDLFPCYDKIVLPISIEFMTSKFAGL